MERLVTVTQFGVGTTEYSREINPDMACNHKSWWDMTEQEKQESSYRSNISHIRDRMETRAKSKQYLFHTVFTTTDAYLRRDIKRFSQIVAKELESQGINHFMFFELSHKQEIWHYDDNDFDAKQIVTKNNYTCYPKDKIENAHGCYNRRAFAPLADNNDMHIHVLTDKPVSFINYVKNVECNPNNLYCGLFYGLYDYIYYANNQSLDALEFFKEDTLKKNVNYMSKLVFYTKSKLPRNMQAYKTNNKKVDNKKLTLILNEYGEILDILRDDFNSDFYNEEKNQSRIEINSFDFEKSDYYKNLNDIDKHNFQVNYIKNLVEVNKFYRNELIFYKKELDFLDKPFTFTNFKLESVLNLKSILNFDTTKFVNKYNQTYYTSTNNNTYNNNTDLVKTLTTKSNSLGSHSRTPVPPNTPVVYSLVCLFAFPVLFTTPVFLLSACFGLSKKSVTYKYRPNISGAKIYALKAKNRLSCKRFRRKRRRLQIKKPSKIKFD